MSVVRLERRGAVALVGLDRPEKRNALDLRMVEELHRVIDTLGDPSITVFHSTTPGTFVAGADITELRDRGADDALRRINGALFDRIAAMRLPTIAVVDGAAYGGGCEFATACDFRFATPRARFAQPEPSLGILAAAGAHQRLERTAGLSVARRMLLGGERLDAAEALRAGLVDRVASPETVLDEAVEYAGRMASASARALELTKLALGLGAPSTAAFDAAAQALLFESDEKRARMSAFLQQRGEGRS
ncbi:enoyl-CoA hydratase/isomerase family protein [Streptomyces muensis]|uniref:Enoyl-CoA hydratase/isomerase family protein n=1 Tax=Streptomyces muensis TaxID=1077944 RepID=A0A9X1PS67_STRM4|nr:enoyl-CoA hydratase/isomerase family protein [Streptomyces muensis]MCF1592537.1 enoyl-CoA hydratase/isomerase family protein [Streptomyces muensis]